MKVYRRIGFALLAAAGMTCLPAVAHQAPGSSVFLDFRRDRIDAELVLPLDDLEVALRVPSIGDPNRFLVERRAGLTRYILERVKPVTDDGRPWAVECRDFQFRFDEHPSCVHARLEMIPPPGASTRRFRFHYSVINRESMSHFSFVSVRNDWDTAVFSSHPQLVGTIQFVTSYLDIDRSAGSWWQGFRSVFRVGLQHIAEGTDHLLFLLVLLLPAPLIPAGNRWGGFGGWRRCFIELLKIVTAFTLGHSLTLAIGAIGWLQLPTRLVEVFIAISILVSAVHAIRPCFAGKEPLIAAFFGLAHGLAFAASISDYGFSTWHLVLTIVAFNLGIEVMQLAVVLMIVPWLILLSRTPAYPATRLTGAWFGTFAALGWIGDRAFGLRNPVEPLVNLVASHPSWLVGALALTALGATFWPRRLATSASRPPAMGLQG